MRHLLAAVVFSVAAGVIGCGDISVTPENKSTKSGVGENCTKTDDCNDGLKCITSECVDPGAATGAPTGGGGESSTTCGEVGDCQPEWMGDSRCDPECNCAEGEWDRGDCN